MASGVGLVAAGKARRGTSATVSWSFASKRERLLTTAPPTTRVLSLAAALRSWEVVVGSSGPTPMAFRVDRLRLSMIFSRTDASQSV